MARKQDRRKASPAATVLTVLVLAALFVWRMLSPGDGISMSRPCSFAYFTKLENAFVPYSAVLDQTCPAGNFANTPARPPTWSSSQCVLMT